MQPILFSLCSPTSLITTLFKQTDCEEGVILLRAFPDEETYVKIDTDIKDRTVIFLATLDNPNEKSLPLFFAAETAKALGAAQVGLIAPYLSYMRQDTQFHPGEGITSNYYAAMLAQHFDWLITVDPHLHRYHAMSEIYTISAVVLHAAPAIANWIRQNISDPLIIGPDAESEQWVSELAEAINAPYVVLQKMRKGDREVEMVFPEMIAYQNRTPVLIDDIISTAVTMIAAVKHLKMLNMKAPICIGIHAIFAGDAYENLQKAGAAKIITCNTIEHASNAIDVGTILAEKINFFL